MLNEILSSKNPQNQQPSLRLINSVKQRGMPVIVEPTNRLSVAHVDDLADLYIALLEAEVPPAIINGVGSIIT